eukprot:1107486-Rhodomonas_salina.2
MKRAGRAQEERMTQGKTQKGGNREREGWRKGRGKQIASAVPFIRPAVTALESSCHGFSGTVILRFRYGMFGSEIACKLAPMQREW